MVVNFSEMLKTQDKMIMELATLNERNKQRKESFLSASKILKYDLQFRIAVFIDPQGLCCIINTHYRTRKFIYLEDRLKIKDIHIMVN